MTMRIAGAVLVLFLATAAAHGETELLIPMTPADSTEEPTSVPDECAQPDVNCVLNDGPPHWVPHRAPQGTRTGAGAGATGATGGSASGAAAGGGAGSQGFVERR